MTESYNGLRFDIFERVHLPDDVAAIEELEEIELVPHMQALTVDDQILLRGHLLLTGSYRSEEERSETRQLEHWIPVEISLPLGRVERLEDLAVEIDNFDVDLLSTRSLNVTGVLGLRGLQVSVPQAPVWQEDSFTVVHQAPPEATQAEEQASEDDRNGAGGSGYPGYPSPDYSWYESYSQREQNPAHAPPAEYAAPPVYLPQIEEPEPEPYPFPPNAFGYGQSAPYSYRPPEPSPAPAEPAYGASYSPQPWGDLSQERVEPKAQEDSSIPGISSVPSAPSVPAVPGISAAPEVPAEPEAPAVPGASAESYVHAEPAPAQPPAEEKPELKVGLNAKSSASAASSPLGVGILSQLGEKGARREAELRIAEEANQADQAALAAQTNASLQANSSSADSSGDEVEWTRLFLAKSGAVNTFRKFKLCIVQREDTLDAIATRYNVQVRELQLHNRLLDPHVTEGQILYIP
ncbi:LysM peptidoglycan-binding domain-containing protein [Cohnella sp. AR92]|uniref:LysM peptidoglycan-binding domain-containing protein n=1 Tax=Cohnella sp. AR92 TaxID=648716 RepID=UPI000F8EC170|nr:LysM peptidoglycan-binding domain-containing protein [Cohnella sp. AR92]RUS47633.1 LysM peptidoglycan-binding domain-containing protein [Cohnella sp. AR92]